MGQHRVQLVVLAFAAALCSFFLSPESPESSGLGGLAVVGMAQQVRRRFQQTVDFSNNNKVTRDLGRGMVYRELQLRLTGQLTCTGANNTAANTTRGDEWGVVKNIAIIANNTEVIRSISGNALWWLNYFFYGARPIITQAMGDGATANPSFDSVLKLPFWLPQSIRPIDTALDARKLSDLKIEITWGTFTDINSAATAFTTAPKIEVNSTECFNLDGKFSMLRVYTIDKPITASSQAFQIQLPVGPMYRGFLINTTDNAVAGGTDLGTILNNLKLRSGSTVFADVKASPLWQEQLLRYGNQRDFGGTTYTKDRIGTKNDIRGWYLYDHVTDGFLSEAIDTLGFAEMVMELDVTLVGTSNIQVFPLEITPVRQSALNRAA